MSGEQLGKSWNSVLNSRDEWPLAEKLDGTLSAFKNLFAELDYISEYLPTDLKTATKWDEMPMGQRFKLIQSIRGMME